jgi:hypothetical protein
VGRLSCACGQVLDRGPEPAETFHLVDAETMGILEESADGGPLDGDDVALIKDCPTVYLCRNCGRAVVEGLQPGRLRYFREVEAVPRIWVDHTDRDALGRIRLRHERTLAEMKAHNLMHDRGVPLIAVWEDGELPGSMYGAVDDLAAEIPQDTQVPPSSGWALEPDRS